MIDRTILIASERVYLRRKWRQMDVMNPESTKPAGSVPIEDLGMLILDGVDVLASRSLLSSVLDRGGVVVVCNDKHQPAGLLWPLDANGLHAGRLRAQIQASLPLKKQLWRQIVQAKLHQQAAVLGDHPTAASIRALADKVQSGDKGNREAWGARKYWPALFGRDFRRDPDGAAPNGALNYGYAILRAATSRAICGAGLHPALGLQHANQRNAFALADDLMEPYRPFVDAIVRDMDPTDDLDRSAKARLIGVLEVAVEMPQGRSPLQVALQRTAWSLAAAFAGERRTVDVPV